MNKDIDDFIREQKAKIATERQYLSNQNLSMKRVDSDFNLDTRNTRNYDSKLNNKNSSDDNFVFKMKEGENMKNRYKQELRDDFSNNRELNKRVDLSSRREKSTERNDNSGLLPGLGYSNSASRKKENQRNQEYNEFKKIDAENFKNRFQDKKNVPNGKPEVKSSFQRNPITMDSVPSSYTPSVIEKRSNRAQSPSPDRRAQRGPTVAFDSKLDMLEKKVEDLRNFHVHDVSYAPDMGDFYDEPVTRQTRRTQPTARSRDTTEQKLRELDETYGDTKSRLMRTMKTGPPARIGPIFDDDSLLGGGDQAPRLRDLEPRGRQNSHQMPGMKASIVPLGRTDDDTAKRQKQEQYRNELQSQMREKSDRKFDRKSAEAAATDTRSFFDRFGPSSDSRKVESSRAPEGKFLVGPEVAIDNEYAFYATRDPLEYYENINYVPSVSPGRLLESTSFPNTFISSRGIGGAAGAGGKTDQTATSRKDNYRDELDRQIEERKRRKESDKKKQDDYERRKNEEISNYDPFGRGGGGAPLKDNHGTTIADLKNFKFDANITMPPSATPTTPYQPTIDLYKPRDKSPVKVDTNEPPTHARGGHGIFGQALTEEDKQKADRYKDDLKTQIEHNKRQKELEKQQERIREAKERDKYEKEQEQIRLELVNEKKLQQQLEQERIRKLEESKLAAKEKKAKELIIEAKAEEQRRRTPSPFVRRESPKPKSPLIVRDMNRPEIQREDSKIASQLHILKSQLAEEKLRVEQALARQKDEVEIYDPRLVVNRPHLDSRKPASHKLDVFQSVLENKGPLSVRREQPKPKDSSNRLNTEEYLDEHLERQYQNLKRMDQPDFSRYELSMQSMNPQDLGIRPQTNMSNKLQSDSAFLDFKESHDFPLKRSGSNLSDNDFSFYKPPSVRPLKPNSEFGSNTSLNVHDLERKNKERLRKLERSQNENENHVNSEELLKRITSVHTNDYNTFNPTLM